MNHNYSLLPSDSEVYKHRNFNDHKRYLRSTAEVRENLQNIDLTNSLPTLRQQDIYLIILVKEDTFYQHSNLDTHLLKPNDLLIVHQKQANRLSHISNQSFSIEFKPETLMPFINTYSITDTFSFLHLNVKGILSLTDAESRLLQHHFQELIHAYYTDSPEKDAIVKGYLYVLLLKLKEVYNYHFGKTNAASSRAHIITRQYKLLVEQHFLSKKTVHEYADLLCITTKHLGDVIKQTLDKTPGELIQEMVLLEAKKLLQQTSMTVTQIAYHLNFEDQSYFCRFFKKHTSQTPVEYRTHSTKST